LDLVGAGKVGIEVDPLHRVAALIHDLCRRGIGADVVITNQGDDSFCKDEFVAYLAEDHLVWDDLANPRDGNRLIVAFARDDVLEFAYNAFTDEFLGGCTHLGTHEVNVTAEFHTRDRYHLLVIDSGFFHQPFHLLCQGFGSAAGGVF